MTQKPPNPLTEDFQLGSWQIQPQAGFIVSGERVVRLEPKVMSLLIALAASAGQVVSRQALLDQVWPGQVVSDEVLTTVISTLRRNLGDDSRESRFIETVPKRGYRLIAQLGPAVDGDDGTPTAPQEKLNRTRLWLFGGALVILIAVLIGRLMPPQQQDLDDEIDSIAVLPFDVFGEDTQLRVFGDGLVEELIHQLSADPELKVTSRTSSFQFRDTGDNIREIGQKLGVNNILEGSIRGDANTLRVTVQFIEAKSDFHRWSRVFDVERNDLLLMQEKVSNEVAAMISGSREATMLQTRLRHPVPNEAYRLYLLGQSQMRVGTVDAYARAAENFSDATRIAPDYPIALTQYAAVRMLLHQYRRDDLDEATRAAREALDRALALDPELPEAQAVYGLLHTYNFDYEAAEVSFKTALAQRPNMVFALHNYGFLLWSQGRTMDLIEPVSKVLDIDPVSGTAHFMLADSLAAVGRFEESRLAFERCNEMIPGNRHCLLGQASLERILGNMDRAERLTDAAAEHVPDDYIYLVTTRMGLALYRQDYVLAEQLNQQVAEEIPTENFVMRSQLLLALHNDDVQGFVTNLQQQRQLMASSDRFDAGLDWVEAHALFLLGNCSGVLDIYEQLLDTGAAFLDNHWPLEFGQSHLTNLLYCQQQTGRRIGAGWVEDSQRALKRHAEESDYPAGLYLLAKLYELDGKNEQSAATLKRLEARGWPFFWIAERDPIFANTQ